MRVANAAGIKECRVTIHPQRKRSLSLNRRQYNIRHRSPWYHNYRKDVHGFPCCDGNHDLLLRVAFLSSHCGLNNKVRPQCGHVKNAFHKWQLWIIAYIQPNLFFVLTEREKKLKKSWSIIVGNTRVLRSPYILFTNLAHWPPVWPPVFSVMSAKSPWCFGHRKALNRPGTPRTSQTCACCFACCFPVWLEAICRIQTASQLNTIILNFKNIIREDGGKYLVKKKKKDWSEEVRGQTVTARTKTIRQVKYCSVEWSPSLQINICL